MEKYGVEFSAEQVEQNLEKTAGIEDFKTKGFNTKQEIPGDVFTEDND